jgi:hypothetical protein
MPVSLWPQDSHALLVAEINRQLRESTRAASDPAAAAPEPEPVPNAPATDRDLHDYVQQSFGVSIPNVACCAGHVPPFRAFADSYFARFPLTIWEASRGFGGKTFQLSLLTSVEAATLRADVTLLAGSGEQAQRVLESTSEFWDYPLAPRHELASEPTREIIRFRTGNKVYRLTASTKSVRGPHPQRLRIDEADEMAWKLFKAASGQTMAKRGIAAQTTVSSTHQYPDGTMTKLLALAADRGHPVYRWCYRENLEPHGWLAQAEVARKKSEVTDDTWLTEYELQEPSPENRAIVTEKVDAMFKRSLGVFQGLNREYIELERPHKRGRYATGADWARSSDMTVIWTFRIDVTPMRLVAFERLNRLPWPQMVDRFDRRVRRYPGPAAHDATGIGDVVDGYIAVEADGIQLVGKQRSGIFSNYVSGIERGEVEAPFIEYTQREHKFATTDDLFGGGHPPDTFVAGAMAYHAATAGKLPDLVVG